MSRYRNDTGGVLTVNDLMRQVGPNEEFDYDPKTFGVIPGCTLLDAPQATGAAEDGQATGQAESAVEASGPAPNASRRRKGAAAEGEETRA